MMTRYAYVAGVAIALAGFATEASGAVRYTFTVDRDVWSDASLRIIYETPDFVRDSIDVKPTSCMASASDICDALDLGFEQRTTVTYGDGPPISISLLSYLSDPSFGAFTFEIGTFTKTGFSTGGEAAFGTGASLLVEEFGVISAIPEPSVWSLMLVGFGIVAGTARYRRRNGRIVYA